MFGSSLIFHCIWNGLQGCRLCYSSSPNRKPLMIIPCFLRIEQFLKEFGWRGSSVCFNGNVRERQKNNHQPHQWWGSNKTKSGSLIRRTSTGSTHVRGINYFGVKGTRSLPLSITAITDPTKRALLNLQLGTLRSHSGSEKIIFLQRTTEKKGGVLWIK